MAAAGQQGSLATLNIGLYHKDDWAKDHPIFEGLPAGGILDHTFYREVISNRGWSGQDAPAEVVAGSINTCLGYGSALTIAVYNLGAAGLRSIRCGSARTSASIPWPSDCCATCSAMPPRDVAKPPVDLPADFEQEMAAWGY